MPSLSHALRLKTSSRNPITAMIRPPKRIVTFSFERSQNAIIVSANATNIATPPMRGIGTLCIRLPSCGTFTAPAPILNARTRTSGVRTKASSPAQRAARAYGITD